MRRFFFAQPREEPALDRTRELLVTLAKKRQRPVEIEKPLRLRVAPDPLFIERHRYLPAATFCRETRARAADDDLPHRARGDREKVPAVFDAHALLARKLQISLVHEPGGVERRAPIGAPEMVASNTAQLVVHHGYETIERLTIASGIRVQKLGDLSLLCHAGKAEYRGRGGPRKTGIIPPMLQAVILATLLAAGSGQSDEAATRVAEQMVEAMGGQENWDQARFIRFTNVRRGRKPVFTWDRWMGRLRIESRDQSGIPFVILMNLNSRQGKVYVEGRLLRGKELSEYLKRGAQMWKGATYWFLMPFKWNDPGVNLAHEGEESFDGSTYDIVHLTFDNEGDAPGDEYWAYVNRDTHLMDRWKFKLAAGFEGDYRWSRWHRYGGIRVATIREGNDEVIRFEDIYVGASMPDELFTSPEPAKFP